MLQIAIRRGIAEDASLITDLIKKMVIEMANFGGHAVNTSLDVWASMESDVRVNCACQDYIYLIAEHQVHSVEVVGIAAANIESLEDIFVVKKRLHIGALYTTPNVRRHGVGRQLLHYLIKWGQQMNAKEIELNVLVANPARQLYEQFGFRPLEISMARSLEDDRVSSQ